jgi:hypothetical protein
MHAGSPRWIRHLERITGEIADYRVRLVEVGLSDSIDSSAPGLFISVGHAATEATGNEFDVSARALISVEQARRAIRQFLTTRQRPNPITGEPAPSKVNQRSCAPRHDGRGATSLKAL